MGRKINKIKKPGQAGTVEVLCNDKVEAPCSFLGLVSITKSNEVVALAWKGNENF